MNKKWLAPILPYLAVWAGLFLFRNAWAALAGFHLAILASMFALKSKVPIEILFRSKHRKWILGSIVLCGISGINLYLFWDVFRISSSLSAHVTSLGLKNETWFAFIAYFVLVNPLVEEYFWRGYLGSAARGLDISDFVFALYHMMILWGQVHPFTLVVCYVFLVAAGWLWRQMRREDEGLLAAALGHAAADFTILICIMLKSM